VKLIQQNTLKTYPTSVQIQRVEHQVFLKKPIIVSQPWRDMLLIQLTSLQMHIQCPNTH